MNKNRKFLYFGISTILFVIIYTVFMIIFAVRNVAGTSEDYINNKRTTALIKSDEEIFELSVIHFNDFHARFEQTNLEGGSCKNDKECIGGYSRLYKQITSIFNEKTNSVLLNAGDSFQGTLWYNIGKWNVTQEFMNKLPIDAEVIGNHEFDDSIDGLVPYIKSLKHPIVVSNIDDSMEPQFKGLYNKSTIIVRNGKKIGIIGVITSDCAKIANTGQLIFFDESTSVNKEAERLVREENVFTVIVISHSGYDVDKIIAQNASDKISLIVGGHSHSFLYTGDNPPGPDNVEGPYPTIVESNNGHKVLVTQASAYCKYLGNITVFLDRNGEIVDYSGAPIYLDSTLPQDESINAELQPWKELIDSQGKQIIGSTLVKLDSSECYNRECILGNFITDAMVYQYTKTAPEGWWSEAAIALVNAGGLRTTIELGNITYGDMIISQPFGNTIDFGQIEGKYIKEAMESAANIYAYGSVFSSLNLIQVSGLKIIYNLTNPEGQKVISIKARCDNCTVPTYTDLILDKLYNIILPSFMATGGDGFTMISDNLKNKRVGYVDIDIFVDYLAHRSPVFQEENGRIVVHKGNLTLIHVKI